MQRLTERLGLRRVRVQAMRSRWYLCPDGPTGQEPSVTLLCLPGRGEGAAAFAGTTGLAAAATRHGLGCAILQGHGTVPDWEPSRDLPVLHALAEDLHTSGSDLVLVGMSRGAVLAHLLAAELSSWVRVLVTVAGVPAAAALPAGLPRLVVHGDLDTVVPPTRASGGASTTIVRLADGGHTWPGARTEQPARLGPVSRWDATAAITALAARRTGTVPARGLRAPNG